ncbi:uncharacterized protein LOC124111242 isoform X1 [Haliotis rufescens]|uniref:uncharacterized protein LOC124111242 isoform X1 n=2 Tax=Haliotis rufescens TaxID=6454 RepID=UPI00201E8DBB|nr:uncharacterized protein LOC124111242 isoform X1 [Haliotis rufescens]XP_046326845.2 uncharacterized protein LOC124111242 isoform X1 [Haliotis rufescens]XP_048243558.1 uncharacterized protein LOC124111242 isoform X1 [Haliotis rufescens]
MLTAKLLTMWDTGGWSFKMLALSLFAAFFMFESIAVTDGAITPVKYLYYVGDQRVANWSNAVAKCAEQNGKLTGDIDIDDWELLYGMSSIFLDDNYFWIGLKREANKDWKWLGGTDLDLNMTAAFPLRPEFKDNITWDCVQWNVKEPFYVPQGCEVPSPFICEIPSTKCDFKTHEGKMLNETMLPLVVTPPTSGATLPVLLISNKTHDQCKSQCETYSSQYECWLYQYDSNLGATSCTLVISEGKPVLINIQAGTSVNLYTKYCIEVEKFTDCKDGEECICGNVTSNPTPEQLEEILEETKEKLTVPTKNLSATIRKKTSAADDRPSSQTMGYFGITMITVTLGGLVLLDCTSMLRDLKIMMYNLQCATGGGKDLPPPTTVHVNLQGGPKQSYA